MPREDGARSGTRRIEYGGETVRALQSTPGVRPRQKRIEYGGNVVRDLQADRGALAYQAAQGQPSQPVYQGPVLEPEGIPAYYGDNTDAFYQPINAPSRPGLWTNPELRFLEDKRPVVTTRPGLWTNPELR